MAATLDGGADASQPVRCGDGALGQGEGCDDGNTRDGDGCSASCQLEAGWQCPAPNAPCSEVCGDGMVVGSEACDDQNQVDDDYCSNDCRNQGSCGDQLVQAGAGEDCDDGNAVTEACAYSDTSCVVCAEDCKKGPGIVSQCGDGQIDADSGEQCDDGNATTETCDYGLTSCTVCDQGCQNAAGATSYCGDGVIDVANGEECDDHGTTSGDGCDASCHVEYVASCGNGVVDASAGETCDDGNTANLDGCSAACRIENGWTCPTVNARCVETCGDTLVVGDEVCDDGNQVDDDYCSNDCRSKRRCGDGTTQAGAGEQCDDGNTTTESCDYQLTSCTVCDSSCHNAAGATSYCGDGVVDAANGEECEPGSDIRCGSDCKIDCDTVYITYATTGNLQLTGTTLGLGDGNYPQTGGTLIVGLRAGPSGPIAGSGAVAYYRFPIAFTQNINAGIFGSATVVTDIVGTSSVCTGASPGTCVPAPDSSNRCFLGAGTLVLSAATGSFPNLLSWGACPYGAHHGTNDWTPDDQQVSMGMGPGCLEYSSQGTIDCNGSLCANAGLTSGVTTTVDDQWDQPGATLEFSADFKSVRSRALGLNNGNGVPNDKFEVPERIVARTWINFDGTETGRSCESKPTNCPPPGAY